ncbi:MULTISPECIES: PTS sugar transporter subunit IIA [Selenomonas]|uniref:Phosphoenolpyruvate-dependent sugar phosphotransferase system, EIIA 2 n=1 Tax=Selenomonas flueggei ATCC 43531 TaxID=638302 RepID=C4V1M5_9FIRM|nr:MULTISPECIES: PTS sugar transporter subunit IIA [Selenomonas]EEQ49351.1 phosphoenolpyruvate-dependent sugar phosphotransferase system, EIIA 2 [Selenomonas flueggei ATCC 43531]EFM22625.1 phosphoenolpyruvate-dependent sugar phosphotransferase system, EIIA 2 [Selenomonas sp. oral taxon 149 str. 67H29BP]
MALLHEDLVLFDVEAADREELLTKLANVLREKGYVKDSYPQAILEREAAYPTGLNTKGVAIAMPHAAAAHAVEAAILVARLKHPVTFKEMGGTGKDVPARLVFMLSIDDPEGHVIMLGKFMSIFCDEGKLVDLYETNNPKAVVEKLSKVVA